MESLVPLKNIENLERAMALHKVIKRLQAAEKKLQKKPGNTNLTIPYGTQYETINISVSSKALSLLLAGTIQEKVTELNSLGFTL